MRNLNRISATHFHKNLLRTGEPSTPVLVSGMTDDWAALPEWAPHRLRKTLKNRRIRVSSSESGEYGFLEEIKFQSGLKFVDYGVEGGDLHGFLDQIETSVPEKSIYLIGHSIPNLFPELAKKTRIPILPVSSQPEKTLWIGDAKSYTPLHFDARSSLLAQRSGRKKICLLAPTAFTQLKMFPRDSEQSHCCVSLHGKEMANPEETQFKEAYVFDLSAGETLFIPAFWFHSVRNVTTSVSVHMIWTTETTQEPLPRSAAALIENWYTSRQLYKKTKRTDAGPIPHLIENGEASILDHEYHNAALFGLCSIELLLRYSQEPSTPRAPSEGNLSKLAAEYIRKSDLSPEFIQSFKHEMDQIREAKAGTLSPQTLSQAQASLSVARQMRSRLG